jgi:hypothetical protein
MAHHRLKRLNAKRKRFKGARFIASDVVILVGARFIAPVLEPYQFGVNAGKDVPAVLTCLFGASVF